MTLYGVRDTRDDGEPSLVGDVIDLFMRREDAGTRASTTWAEAHAEPIPRLLRGSRLYSAAASLMSATTATGCET